MSTNISIYKNINDTKTSTVIPLDTFLQNIQSGLYQDEVLAIRKVTDKAARSEAKKKLPNVTISGTFTERTESGLLEHSGFIGIDIDDLNNRLEAVRNQLSTDSYVYAIFASASGNGLCVLFKIEADKHHEAFEGIAAYLYQQYQIAIDRKASNKSRARFASFDPDLRMNRDALKFKKYLPKERAKKLPKAIYVETDFDAMINELAKFNICEAYGDWIQIGFALVDRFGAGGSKYFHSLSATSSKYNYEDCEEQYQILLRADTGKSKTASIGTVFYYAKQHNIAFYSDTTKKVISTATLQKKSGVDAQTAIKNIYAFDQIPPEMSEAIVNAVYTTAVDIKGEDSIIVQIENYLRYNYTFQRNIYTRKIEVNAKDFDTKEFNTVFIAAKKIFDKDISAELLDRTINSAFTPDFNPFSDFIDRYKHIDIEGAIKSYCSCFFTDDAESFFYFFTKWYVGIMSNIFAYKSPLVLVFTGDQNTGKTRAFRELLPKELRMYYAESKLDRGKDDEILMCQKLIICDDEFGGKSKAESKHLKDITSKDIFSVREPYGRHNIDMRRLATLCGTSNDVAILNDPTGNRRIIPVNIKEIDFKRINNIDRSAMFVEAFKLYSAGFETNLQREEIIVLAEKTESFNDYSLEYELLNKYYRVPDANDTNFDELTASDIKVRLENKSNQTLNLYRLGLELKRSAFVQRHKKLPGNTTARIYKCIEITELAALTRPEAKIDLKDLPF